MCFFLHTFFILVSALLTGHLCIIYLYSVYHHYGGLQLMLPTLIEGQKPKLNQYPVLFRKMLTSVLEIFKGEQHRLQDSGSEVVPQLIQEFLAYAYNKEPFCSHPWNRETKPLKWWTQLSKDSNARLISVSFLFPKIEHNQKHCTCSR